MNKIEIIVDKDEIEKLIELNNNLKNYIDNNDKNNNKNNNLLENIEIIDKKLNKLLPPKITIYALTKIFCKLFIEISIMTIISLSSIVIILMILGYLLYPFVIWYLFKRPYPFE